MSRIVVQNRGISEKIARSSLFFRIISPDAIILSAIGQAAERTSVSCALGISWLERRSMAWLSVAISVDGAGGWRFSPLSGRHAMRSWSARNRTGPRHHVPWQWRRVRTSVLQHPPADHHVRSIPSSSPIAPRRSVISEMRWEMRWSLPADLRRSVLRSTSMACSERTDAISCIFFRYCERSREEVDLPAHCIDTLIGRLSISPGKTTLTGTVPVPRELPRHL